MANPYLKSGTFVPIPIDGNEDEYQMRSRLKELSDYVLSLGKDFQVLEPGVAQNLLQSETVYVGGNYESIPVDGDGTGEGSATTAAEGNFTESGLVDFGLIFSDPTFEISQYGSGVAYWKDFSGTAEGFDIANHFGLKYNWEMDIGDCKILMRAEDSADGYHYAEEEDAAGNGGGFYWKNGVGRVICAQYNSPTGGGEFRILHFANVGSGMELAIPVQNGERFYLEAEVSVVGNFQDLVYNANFEIHDERNTLESEGNTPLIIASETEIINEPAVYTSLNSNPEEYTFVKISAEVEVPEDWFDGASPGFKLVEESEAIGWFYPLVHVTWTSSGVYQDGGISAYQNVQAVVQNFRVIKVTGDTTGGLTQGTPTEEITFKGYDATKIYNWEPTIQDVIDIDRTMESAWTWNATQTFSTDVNIVGAATADTFTAATDILVGENSVWHAGNFNPADYYTAALLDAGQLDNRYYTETETDNLLDTKIDESREGIANGIATLDSNVKIPLSQIPDSIIGQVEYQGTWNANTDTPTLQAPSTVKGHYFVVSTGGTYAGITFQVGDWVISDGVVWDKVDNTDAVQSVAGRTGAVVIDWTDVNNKPAFATRWPTWGEVTGKPDFYTETEVDNLLAGKVHKTATGLANNVSLNTANTAGFFRLANGHSDAPSWNDFSFGQMVVSEGQDTIAQIVVDYNTQEMGFRGGNPPEAGGGGTWQPWARVWHSGNFTPTDDIEKQGANNYTKNLNYGLYTSATSGVATGGWARAHKFGDGDHAHVTADFGALGGVDSITYAFISAGKSDGNSMAHGDAQNFRVYPDKITWGTDEVWHEGNFDPADYAHRGGNNVFSGRNNFYTTDTTASYPETAIELREVNLVGSGQIADEYAPRLTWHWGGRVQSNISLSADGNLYIAGSAQGSKKLLYHEGNLPVNVSRLSKQITDSFDSIGDKIIILCPGGGSSTAKDVMGQILAQRSSGNRYATTIDFNYSTASSSDTYDATLAYALGIQNNNRNITLVEFTFESGTWIGIRLESFAFAITNMYFDGYSTYQGSNFLRMVETSGVTGLTTLTTEGRKVIKNSHFNFGNLVGSPTAWTINGNEIWHEGNLDPATITQIRTFSQSNTEVYAAFDPGHGPELNISNYTGITTFQDGDKFIIGIGDVEGGHTGTPKILFQNKFVLISGSDPSMGTMVAGSVWTLTFDSANDRFNAFVDEAKFSQIAMRLQVGSGSNINPTEQKILHGGMICTADASIGGGAYELTFSGDAKAYTAARLHANPEDAEALGFAVQLTKNFWDTTTRTLTFQHLSDYGNGNGPVPELPGVTIFWDVLITFT